MPNVNQQKMKSALLYLGTRSKTITSGGIVHARNLALLSAIYTLVSAFQFVDNFGIMQ